MRIAQINMLHAGSTGKIMFELADRMRAEGHTVHTFSPRYYSRLEKTEFPKKKDHFYFGWRFENMLHVRAAQLTGFHGCFSLFGTMQLVRMLDEFRPDVIHLHNLHNWTVNLPVLFGYIRRRRIRVIWTLHDCWAFTGQCPHYLAAKCDKWKKGCFACPQVRQYPQSFVDRTRVMYRMKKRWFCDIENMTIATPSRWLAEEVKQSFLKEYPVRVINNGINLSVFRPTPSDFRQKYGLQDKKIVLGVAFGWGYKKGLDVLIDLAGRLDERYAVVLVGTDERTDRQLPAGVVSIHKTADQKELAAIYTAADVFVNPTREDNFPTVNIEALACGTPVVTFDVGGSPEIPDGACGETVPCEDTDALVRAIIRLSGGAEQMRSECLRRGREFDQSLKFSQYAELISEGRE